MHLNIDTIFRSYEVSIVLKSTVRLKRVRIYVVVNYFQTAGNKSLIKHRLSFSAGVKQSLKSMRSDNSPRCNY